MSRMCKRFARKKSFNRVILPYEIPDFGLSKKYRGLNAGVIRWAWQG
jgi:hypothetical protein